MKTKLFILTMLLMIALCGCSKESYTIVGDWYLCSLEYSDSSDPEAYYFEEYTKENSIGFISFTADGKGVQKEPDMGVFFFHWTLVNGKLTITLEDSNQSYSDDIVFEGNNKFCNVMRYGTESQKVSFQRM